MPDEPSGNTNIPTIIDRGEGGRHDPGADAAAGRGVTMSAVGNSRKSQSVLRASARPLAEKRASAISGVT